MAEEEKVDATESPTMPEVETKQEAQVDPAASLREMLEAHNIQGPDDFTGLVNELHTYKKGYGDSRNEVGELRRQLEEIQAQLSPSNRRYRQPSPYDNEYDEPQGQSVDLERVVGSVVRKEVTGILQDYERQQVERWETYNRQRADVESRPNWSRVQPMFDKALQNPTVAAAINSGNLSMGDLYSRLNERFLMSQVDNLLKSIPGDVKLTPSGEPPTQQNIQQQPTVEEEQKTKVKKAVEDKNPEAVLDNLFPDNDPIFR